MSKVLAVDDTMILCSAGQTGHMLLGKEMLLGASGDGVIYGKSRVDVSVVMISGFDTHARKPKGRFHD